MSTYLTVWVDIPFPAGALILICSCVVLVVRYWVQYVCVEVREGGRSEVGEEGGQRREIWR